MNVTKLIRSACCIIALTIGCLLATSCRACCTSTTATQPLSSTGCCPTSSCDSCRGCTTVLIGRSSNDNTAYFDGTLFAYLPDMCEFNTGITFGYAYQQTFDKCNLARCLFGTNQLVFQGSKVAAANATSSITTRNPNALIADYFGLSQEFNGTLDIDPSIKCNNLHVQWYLGFDNATPGLYVLFDLTFSNQKRSLFNSASNCIIRCDTSCTSGCNAACATPPSFIPPSINVTPFPVGYMTDGGATATPTPTATFLRQALSGGFLFGDMQTPWSFGRWTRCPMVANRVAGFAINFGYNFWSCDTSHVGLFARYAAPTGTQIGTNQTYGSFLFAPVIGLQYHQLGGGLTAHQQLWSGDCDDTLTLFVNGYATHLFSACSLRSFDFTGRGCMSRYMLLKQLTPTSAPEQYTYAGSLINAINYTTRLVDSSFAIQGDVSARLIYQRDGFSAAVGYNFFGRSREKVRLQSCNNIPCGGVDPSAIYGMKGCLGVASYAYTIAAGNATTSAVPFSNPLNATATLSATATSCGTITAGNVNTPGATSPTTADNPVNLITQSGVNAYVAWDNAYTPATNPAQANAIVNPTPVATLIQAYDSQPAVLVNLGMLDINSGRSPRLITNKGFAHIDYMWECCTWAPYIGIGGEVEGGSSCCDIRQWGAWMRIGFGF